MGSAFSFHLHSGSDIKLGSPGFRRLSRAIALAPSVFMVERCLFVYLCLPACMYVYHVPALCLWRPEEGERPWIIVSNALNPHTGAEIQTGVLCKSSACSYLLTLSQCVVFITLFPSVSLVENCTPLPDLALLVVWTGTPPLLPLLSFLSAAYGRLRGWWGLQRWLIQRT